MPLMQLQILMIVLGLALLGVIVAMAVPRLRLPAFALPNLRFALPALSLPGMMRPKRSGEAPDQSEPLDPVRLARLQKTAVGDAPATAQEEDQQEVQPATPKQQVDGCQTRLEALFNAFERGELAMSDYCTALDEEMATVRRAAEDIADTHGNAWIDEVRREALSQRAEEAIQAVRWCIDWTREYSAQAWDEDEEN